MRYSYNFPIPDFSVSNIEIISASRPQGYRHQFRNGRGNNGFIYVVSGQMHYSVEGEKKRDIYADVGELIFMPKGTVYTGIYAGADTSIKVAQFDILSGELPTYLSEPTKIEVSNAKELIDSFFRPTKNRLSPHPFYYVSCLFELLSQIHETHSSMPKKYKRLRPAITEMSEHLSKNEPVFYYAELCNMSEVNFRRLFREYTGMSPIDYRNDLRLINAKSMLQSGEYNVSESAEESGFSNLSFFIRLYKKKYGYTPKKE